MDKFLIVCFALCAFNSILAQARTVHSSLDKSIETIECISTGKNQWEQQAHPTICGWFVLCMNDIGIVSQCPDDFLFNEKLEICDLPENVSCDDLPTTTHPDDSTINTTLIETTDPDPTTEDTTIQDTTTEDTTVEDTTTENTTVEYTTTENTTVEDTTVEDTTNENTTVEDTTTEDTTTEDDTTTPGIDFTETTNEEETTTEESQTTNVETDVTTEVIDSTVEDVTTEGTTESVTELYCESLCAGFRASFGETAHPDHCDRFISCTDNCNGAAMFCPSGLHFNHIISACDLPGRAECLLEVCAGKPNGYIPSVNSCHYYYICTNSNAILERCDMGLVFDPVLKSCVRDSDNNTCLVLDIPKAPTDFYSECSTSVADQALRHPTRCDVFYRCVRGMLSSRICLDGLLFDETLGMCNLSELVDCDETEQQANS